MPRPPMLAIVGTKKHGKTTLVVQLAAELKRRGAELGPEEIVDRHMMEASIVLCEGFKQTSLPRIEIFRKDVGERPIYEPASPAAAHYRAIITDDDTLSPPHVRMLRFSDPDWLGTLATFVEREVMCIR